MGPISEPRKVLNYLKNEFGPNRDGPYSRRAEFFSGESAREHSARNTDGLDSVRIDPNILIPTVRIPLFVEAVDLPPWAALPLGSLDRDGHAVVSK